jgi:hypothetical protein
VRQNLSALSISFFIFILLQACVSAPVKYFSDKFIIIKTEQGDNFAELAEKYLNDPEKGWLISEFNNIEHLREGREVIIPLDPFKLGGLSSEGFQAVPILNYTGILKNEFSNQLKILLDAGYSVAGMPELLAFFEFRNQLPEKTVVLTFEISPNDFELNILPVLIQNNVPAILFISLPELEKSTELEKEFLKGLAEHNISLNARGGSDFRVEDISDYKSFQDYFNYHSANIAGLKKHLMALNTGSCIFYAAAAKKNTTLLVNLLKKNGFTGAFNNEGESNPFFTDMFNISRKTVDGKSNITEIRDNMTVFIRQELK